MTSAPRFAFADRVRAVLFDAGNTLLWIDHARIAEVLRARGIAAEEGVVRLAEMRARPRLDPYLRTAAVRESEATRRRYAELVVEGLGRPGDARAVDAVLAEWPRLWCRPPADAEASLAALTARGYLLGCVSNANGTVRSLLETAGLAGHLRCVVDSAIERVEKPSPRIFHIAAERLGVAPAACLYVGDFLSVDVEGARGAGMEAVLLDPADAWDVGADVPRVASLADLVARL